MPVYDIILKLKQALMSLIQSSKIVLEPQEHKRHVIHGMTTSLCVYHRYKHFNALLYTIYFIINALLLYPCRKVIFLFSALIAVSIVLFVSRFLCLMYVFITAGSKMCNVY